jgi:hypothetical protein
LFNGVELELGLGSKPPVILGRQYSSLGSLLGVGRPEFKFHLGLSYPYFRQVGLWIWASYFLE